ncbi:MAG: hypothetical protein M3258_03255 [Thermoproteota archaeon]|nr:hypothetical protein [Thermoproteota archaeon]
MSQYKLDRLIKQAKSIVISSNNPDRMSLWHAYVALEYAILDLKLRHGLEGNPPPKAVRSADLADAELIIGRLDPYSKDKKKLLYDLRLCRNIVKALVESYDDRRSTTS